MVRIRLPPPASSNANLTSFVEVEDPNEVSAELGVMGHAILGKANTASMAGMVNSRQGFTPYPPEYL